MASCARRGRLLVVEGGLVVQISKSTKYLVGSKIPFQELIAETTAANRCPDPYPVSGLEVDVPTTKVVPGSVDTLFILNSESGELANFFGSLSNHLGVGASIVSWFVR